MADRLLIRPERAADHPAVADVVRRAFVRQPDDVASFVERIRASEHFIPELALVAEDDSGVRDALGRGKAAGEPAVMVEGIPGYYPRFGFEPAISSASSPRIRRSPTRRSWSGGWPGTPPTWPGGSSTRPRSRRSAASSRR